jgi:hypothetical protein
MVSVVVSSFNNARFVVANIDSVLGQTLEDLELIVVDAGGRRIGRIGRHFPYHGGDIYRDLFLARFVPPSPTSLFVRQRLVEAGSFDERRSKVDYDTWLRVARLGPVAYVPEPLGSWRGHEGNQQLQASRAHAPLVPGQRVGRPGVRPRAGPVAAPGRGPHRVRAAASYFDALDLRRARMEALPQCAGWRTVVLSLLGASSVRRLRERRRATA